MALGGEPILVDQQLVKLELHKIMPMQSLWDIPLKLRQPFGLVIQKVKYRWSRL